MARENKNAKENRKKDRRRYYRIAGITIQIDSDLPIQETTFHPKFKHFEVNSPGKDIVTFRHQFHIPDFRGKDLGKEVYHKPPWSIYRNGNSWVYLGISPLPKDKRLNRAAFFNAKHTSARIYNKENYFHKGNLHSLTLMPTDLVILARLLADRQGCVMHSCGVNLDGEGLLFVGHSSAGKSTMAKFLKGKAEILCDDRIIIRRHGKNFKIHGTWSHGEVPDVSGSSAPLKAIMFLKKAKVNKLVLLEDKKEITRRLLACLIRPLATAEWWEKMLAVVENITNRVPCYELYFDRSGKVVRLFKKL